MENQHQKITGYRNLSQEEINLMNEGKELAERVAVFVHKLQTEFTPARSAAASGSYPFVDQRWVAIGATQLQQGFMALTRSIAKPTSF